MKVNHFTFNDPHLVCRAYAEGRISPRQAAASLGLSGGQREFIELLHHHGFTHPQPDPETSQETMNRLEMSLYGEDELS